MFFFTHNNCKIIVLENYSQAKLSLSLTNIYLTSHTSAEF